MVERLRNGLLIVLVLLLTSFAYAQLEPTPPVVHLPGCRTPLEDIGLYTVRYTYRDGRSGAMPIGWSGHFDPATGISCTPFGTQAGQVAFLLHPPWRNGTGTTDQEFRLALPAATKITLHFAIAMKEDAIGSGKSDGATFRLFLDGVQKLDQNKTDATWSEHTLDLTPYAGKTITLRFETDPGPKDDPSFDFALWGGRAIVVDAPAAFVSHPVGATRLTILPASDGARPTSALERPGTPVMETEITAGTSAFLGGLRATVDPSPAPPRAHWTSPLIGVANNAYLDLVAPDGHVVRSDAPEVKATATQEPLPGQNGVLRRLSYLLGARSTWTRLFCATRRTASRSRFAPTIPTSPPSISGSSAPSLFGDRSSFPTLEPSPISRNEDCLPTSSWTIPALRPARSMQPRPATSH